MSTAIASPYETVITSSDVSNSTTTLMDISDLTFSVMAGAFYFFKFSVVYQGTVTNNAFGMSLVFPASTTFAGSIRTPQVGTGERKTPIITSGALLTVTGQLFSANTNYTAFISGTITPSSDGTMYPQFRKASASPAMTFTVKTNSCAYLLRIA